MPDPKKMTLRYLGPAVRISPGYDPETGEPKPFVEVGNEITLDERQVLLLEQEGHQFEGRQQQSGDLLRGSTVGYQPTRAQRPEIPAPPDTVPPVVAATTYGGQIPPTAEAQQEIAAGYAELKTEDPASEPRGGRHKS